MRRAIVIEHLHREGPLRIADHLLRRKVAVEVLPAWRGARIPTRLPADTLLVVMGGPMGVADIATGNLGFLTAEVELLATRILDDLPTLGVCLGSQLLAHAAGARVFPNPRGREVGFAPVEIVAPADPLCAGLPPQLTTLHWHGDTFDLPAGATLLASTALCAHQAYRLKRRLIGLQFHPEVDRPTLDAWLHEDADYVHGACGTDGAERIRADAARLWNDYTTHGDLLIANVLDALLG